MKLLRAASSTYNRHRTASHDQGMTPMRKAIWIASVMAVAVAIAGYVFFSGERKPPIRYRTAPVERGAIVSTVTATGTINPVTTVQVGSQVSGMIETLNADFNSNVNKDQIVGRI